MTTTAAATAPLERPVFILGLNKSSTHLLYLCLSRHSELSPIRSFKIAPNLNDNLMSLLSGADKTMITQTCGTELPSRFDYSWGHV